MAGTLDIGYVSNPAQGFKVSCGKENHSFACCL